MKYLTIIIFISAFCGCEIFNSPDNLSNNTGIDTLSFRELSVDEVPPCLNPVAYVDTCIIKSRKDYDSIKIRYAPQGGYENFIANGIETRFRLSYPPLDVNYDKKIGPEELIIYISGLQIFTTYLNTSYMVNTNPIHIINDSIYIYKDSLKMKVPYYFVFDVDSNTGEVTFVSPPPNGNRISISAAKRLYDEYSGRTCNMNYFDFSKYSIIEKEIYSFYPNPRVIGINKTIIKNESQKIIIYYYKPVFGNEISPEIHRYRSWVAIDKITDGYKVIFKETN